MITQQQCRAARGILGWTQQDLASAAGLSKTAINNFERGTHEMRGESLRVIRNAFEKNAIEFVGDYGVHIRRDSAKILKGPEALTTLWDDIFQCLKKDGGEVLITNLDERRTYEGHKEKLLKHLERLRERNITERLLSCEGDDFFLQPRECYRWLPKDIFRAGMSSFIYDKKVALQLWDESMIIVIDSIEAHDMERQRFEYLWDSAIIPPQD